MRKTGIALTIAVLLVAAAVAGPRSYASTTYTGETGLLLAPSADTLGTNSLAITYGHLRLVNIVSVGVGLTPNFEIGVGSAGFGEGSGSAYPLLKLRLVGESRDMPAVAVGLEDKALYVAASKRLSARGARAHVGFGSGRFDGLFAGVDLVLNPVSISNGGASGFPVTTLMGEYVGGGFNVGARFDIARGLAVNLGLLDMDSLSAGVSFKMKF
ncbi:MAG: YjbH domain-containing protein [Bacillota bacterium]|nr:YjbH domain-containing protein [Bacillota bacterium]